jgi:hypothetical protein
LRRPRYSLDSIIGSVKALPGASPNLRREIKEATAEEMERKFPHERYG